MRKNFRNMTERMHYEIPIAECQREIDNRKAALLCIESGNGDDDIVKYFAIKGHKERIAYIEQKLTRLMSI
jgi:hypothetical protein